MVKQKVIKVLITILLLISVIMITAGIYLFYKNREKPREESSELKHNNGAIVEDTFSYSKSSYESYIEKMGLPNVTKVITYNNGKVDYIVGYSDDIVKRDNMKEVREATENDKITYSKILYEQLKQEAEIYEKANK